MISLQVFHECSVIITFVLRFPFLLNLHRVVCLSICLSGFGGTLEMHDSC
jgi:hypothetical protein